MAKVIDLNPIQTGIAKIFNERTAALYALCRAYASKAQRALMEKQGRAQDQGFYWTNRTSDAIHGVRGFTETTDGGNSVAWGLMHTVEYGKFLEMARSRQNAALEMARSRQNAALEPTVRELAPDFYEDLRKIFG